MIEKTGSWLLAFGLSQKAKDSTAKNAKDAKERELNYQLTTNSSRYYDLDLQKGLNRRERRESKEVRSSDFGVYGLRNNLVFLCVLGGLCGELGLAES
jgi:hypothetical protein